MSFAIDWPLFLSTYGLIFLAELPDKTAFACLLLGARRHPVAAFIGVAAAFAVQSLVAVLAGQVMSLAPERWVHLGAGVLFLVFAVFIWRAKREEMDPDSEAGGGRFWKSVAASFLVIFIAEWGDLTQLATATLQAKYHLGFTIFLSSTLALWTVSGLGILIGRIFHQQIHPRFLNIGAAIAFVAVGIYFIVESIRG